MSNAFSRVALPQPGNTSYVCHGLDTVSRLRSPRGLNAKTDLLRQLPTELRLMIFEELLVLWPKIVFRGTQDYGPLDQSEVDEEIQIPWQILLTCWKYYEEAIPIMYGKNRFAFCTGNAGKPGMFWRFPIARRCMPYITDLGIYFRVDSPYSEASTRVGHFLKAIRRNATHLDHLTIVAASDRYYDAQCPWDILFGHHPVSKELLQFVEKKPVKHLKIRLHNEALFFPQYACWLSQTFEQTGGIDDHSLTFTRSCTCPPGCPVHPLDECAVCGWPKESSHPKPIEVLVHPSEVEAGMVRMMEMQDDLFHLGIMQFEDDDDQSGMDEDEDEDFILAGPYRVPLKDVCEEARPVFHSGQIREDKDGKKKYQPYCLLPDRFAPYRGEMKAPKEWYFRQAELLEYLTETDYETYLSTVFRPIH